MPDTAHLKLAIIGLGYVGLPLAVEFGKKRPVLGFDINPARIRALHEGHDATLEVSDEELRTATGLRYSDDPADLAECNVFIVTVPTPIDAYKRPDLGPLESASRTVGRAIRPGQLIHADKHGFLAVPFGEEKRLLEAAGSASEEAVAA